MPQPLKEQSRRPSAGWRDRRRRGYPAGAITAIAGYFAYIARRVSGTLLVAIVVHGLRDLALFSNSTAGETHLRQALFVLTDVVLGLVALFTFRKVFPRGKQETATATRGCTGLSAASTLA